MNEKQLLASPHIEEMDATSITDLNQNHNEIRINYNVAYSHLNLHHFKQQTSDKQ